MNSSIYLSEFQVGDKFRTGNQTISETTVTLYAGITGDFHPVHMDQVYAESLPFGCRISHGLLNASVAMALWSRMGLLDESAICQLSCSWVFKAPVRFGDTIHDEVEVTEIRRSASKPDRGVLTIRMDVLNQNGETVCTAEVKAMVKWERPDTK